MAFSDGRRYFAQGYFATGYWHPNYWSGEGAGAVIAAGIRIIGSSFRRFIQ